MAIPRTRTFGALAWWLETTKDHLMARWQEHIVPGIAIFAFSMVVAMTMVVGLVMLMMGAGLAIEILDSEWPVFVVLALMGPLIIGVGVLTQLATGLYLKAFVAVEGDQPLDPKDMVPGVRDVVGLVLIYGITITSVLTGLLFCYFPGIIVGAVLACAPALFFIEGKGPFQALIRSVRLTMLRPIDTISLGLLKIIAGMLVGAVPGVGMLLAMALVPFYIVLDVTMTRSLVDLERTLEGRPDLAKA